MLPKKVVLFHGSRLGNDSPEKRVPVARHPEQWHFSFGKMAEFLNA